MTEATTAVVADTLVAGLVARPKRVEDEDTAKAVREREKAIASRARELAEEAVQRGEQWVRPFGPPPSDTTVAEAWWDRLAVVAAYRERWHVTGPGILGHESGVGSLQQAAHRARARRAGQEAAVLRGLAPPVSAFAPIQANADVELGPEVDL